MFGFVAFVFVVVVGVHLYLWKRLVRDTMRPSRLRKLAGFVVLLLALLIPATLIGTRTGFLEFLAWPGYLWLALMFYLLVILVVLEIPRLIVSLVWRFNRRGAPAGGAGSTAGAGTAHEADAPHATIPAGGTARDATAPATVPAGGTARDATAPATIPAGGTARDATEQTTVPAGGPALGVPAGGTTTAHGEDTPPGNVPASRAGTTDPSSADEATGGAGAIPAQSGPGQDPDGQSRRLVLARGAAIFAGLTAAAITGNGVRTALGPPQVDRVRIPVAKLPRAMDGTRLAVVSDIHLGPLTGNRHMSRIVETINSVDADVVCIVGDMVDGTVEELGRFAEPLRDIRSRHGAYFVTGNHEYYSGFEPWIDEVTRLGVRPLRNERLEIVTRSGAFDLAGVNDLGGAEFDDAPDFERALGGRDTSRPVVLMAHQPVVARDAAPYGVDLQVSGHTHGGQMVPFNYLVKLQQPVVAGYGEVDGVPVYVTNGAGFWGPPVRVGVPPQVTLIELQAP